MFFLSFSFFVFLFLLYCSNSFLDCHYEILSRDPALGGWWMGRAMDGKTGIFPSNYIKEIPVPPKFLDIKKTGLLNWMEKTVNQLQWPEWKKGSLGSIKKLSFEKHITIVLLFQLSVSLPVEVSQMIVNYLIQDLATAHEIPSNEVSAMALYDFDAEDANEINLRENDKYDIIDRHEDGWWNVRDQKSGKVGLAPSNYVAVVPNPPKSLVLYKDILFLYMKRTFDQLLATKNRKPLPTPKSKNKK